MSNTNYESHSEAQRSGFAVERTSSGENELSSRLTEANDSELVRTSINWKARIKNKIFWIALIPAVLLLVQTVCSVFGIELDFGSLQDKLLLISKPMQRPNLLFAQIAATRLHISVSPLINQTYADKRKNSTRIVYCF